MKFKIESSGCWNKPLEKTYPALKEFNYKQESANCSYSGVIYINSLEELMKLKDSVGAKLIIEDSYDRKQQIITICDDYFELGDLYEAD
jgi:hypothetical protein